MEHKWGTSRVIHQEKRLIVVRATAFEEGGRSSIHYHRDHDNGITVLDGVVEVQQFDLAGEEAATRQLVPGQSMTIAAMTYHRLRFVGEAEIMEWYTCFHGDATLADIVRMDEGQKGVA